MSAGTISAMSISSMFDLVRNANGTLTVGTYCKVNDSEDALEQYKILCEETKSNISKEDFFRSLQAEENERKAKQIRKFLAGQTYFFKYANTSQEEWDKAFPMISLENIITQATKNTNKDEHVSFAYTICCCDNPENLTKNLEDARALIQEVIQENHPNPLGNSTDFSDLNLSQTQKTLCNKIESGLKNVREDLRLMIAFLLERIKACLLKELIIQKQ